MRPGVRALRSAWRTRGARSNAWLERLSWLGYGVVLSFIYNGWLNSHAATNFTCQRYVDVLRATQALNRGLPVLTALYPGGGYYPAGYGDDAGPYLYLPVIGHITGQSNPMALYRSMFVVLMSLALIVWPLLMRSLFRSRAAGVVLPAILLPLIMGLPGNNNQYWIAGWCTAICLPLVLLATREESRRRRIALLLAASVVAGFAQSMRANAGIAIPITGVIVVLWRERAWRSRLAVGVAVVAVYWMAGSGVIRVANAIRDGKIGNQPLAQGWREGEGGTTISSRDGGGHVLWHSVYVGLGFEPNKYGIRFADASAFEYARTVDPTVRYLSPQYATILRNRILHLVIHDPGFVLGETIDKASFVLATGLGHSLPILLLLPLLLVLGSRRVPIRRWLLLCVPGLLVALAAPTLVVPTDPYMLAFNQVMRFVLLLEIGWAVAELAAILDRRPAGRPDGPPLYRRAWAGFTARSDLLMSPGTRDRRRSRRTSDRARPRGQLASLLAARRSRLAVAVVVVEALMAAWAASSYASLKTDQFYLSATQRPTVAPFAKTSAVRTWSLSGGLPSDWTLLRGHVSAAGGGGVFDTGGRNDIQTISPYLTLGPGNYALQLDGHVIHGGMIIGVQAVVARTLKGLAAVAYSYRVPTSTYTTQFHLSGTTTVRIYLANRGPGVPSRWSLSTLTLGKTNANVFAATPTASLAQRCTPTPAPATQPQAAPATGKRLAAWDFAHPQPRWLAVNGAALSPGRGAATITDGAGSFDYQLAGPLLTLPPGSYRIDMHGAVRTGGIAYLIYNPIAKSLVARSSPIGSGLPGATDLVNSTSFTLQRNTPVRLIVTNDNVDPRVITTWRLDSFDVYRVR